MTTYLNGEAVLEGSVYFPTSGAWSAELQVASEAELAAGDAATLDLEGTAYTGTVVRAGLFGERLRVRLTGGALDWSEAVDVRHYRNVSTDDVLADVGVTTTPATGGTLPFWTRRPGTVGTTVDAVAATLGVPWRILPDGSVRIAAESPVAIDAALEDAEANEIERQPERGIIVLAAESGVVQPGTTIGDDAVGDVVYLLAPTGTRVRYYTEQRSRLWAGLERLVRWVVRDTLFLGVYPAEVIAQAADGTVDLVTDDERLRAQGLQAVPIRNGLPGTEVDVPAGTRVLLSFEAGDPRKPVATLWEAGTAGVTAVRIGGALAVALAELVDARLQTIQTTFDAHTHITTATIGASATPGVISPPAGAIGPLESVAAEKLFTE